MPSRPSGEMGGLCFPTVWLSCFPSAPSTLVPLFFSIKKSSSNCVPSHSVQDSRACVDHGRWPAGFIHKLTDSMKRPPASRQVSPHRRLGPAPGAPLGRSSPAPFLPGFSENDCRGFTLQGSLLPSSLRPLGRKPPETGLQQRRDCWVLSFWPP